MSKMQVKICSYEYSNFTYKVLKNIILIVTKVVELNCYLKPLAFLNFHVQR